MGISQTDLYTLDYYFKGKPQVDASTSTTHEGTQGLDYFFGGKPYVANAITFASIVEVISGNIDYIGQTLSVQNATVEANTVEVIAGNVDYIGQILSVINPEANTVEIYSGNIDYIAQKLNVITGDLKATEIDIHMTHLIESTHMSAELNTFDSDWFYPYIDFAVSIPLGETSLTENGEVDIETFSIYDTTALALSFLQDFYYRIHISYTPLSLGNVLSVQIHTVDVWNAYFNNNLLSDVPATDLDGIEIESPEILPYSFTPLQNLTFSITVSDVGSPYIDGYYTFEFASEDAYLVIIGQRVIVWPFPPLLPFTETKVWQTDIVELRSSDAKYQIREYPRMDISCQYMLNDQEKYSYARTLARNVVDFPMALPQWSTVLSVGVIGLGVALIECDTTRLELQAEDEVIIIYQDWNHFDVLEVDEFTDTSITTKTNTTLSYTNAYVAPLRIGYLQDGISLTRGPRHDITAAINLKNIVFNFYNAIWPDPNTYQSLPVFEQIPIVTGDLNEVIERPMKYFDSENYTLIGYSPIDHNRFHGMIRMFAHTVEDKYTLRRRVDYFKGKYTTFWLPTYNKDLVAAQDIQNGINKLYVEEFGWAKYKENYIRVRGDSTAFYQITAVETEALYPGQEVLRLSPTPDTDIINIYSIDVIYKVRADTDRIEMLYDAGILKVAIPVIEEP